MLALTQDAFGEEHVDTAASYNNLAFIINAQGRFAEAESLYQKALEIRARVLGEEHPETAISYSNLAFNLCLLYTSPSPRDA